MRLHTAVVGRQQILDYATELNGDRNVAAEARVQSQVHKVDLDAMDSERVCELLDLARVAIDDALVVGVSQWGRLKAAYDAAVCMIAVLAKTDVPYSTVEDEEMLLERLLASAQVDAETEKALFVLSAKRQTPAHLIYRITEHDVQSAVRAVDHLYEQVYSTQGA